MNHIQVEVIFLNLLRQTDELMISIIGRNPDVDAGCFRARLVSLFDTFNADKTGFAASSFSLGLLANLLKEYAGFKMQSVDSVGIPEILTTVTTWGEIPDKPALAAANHTHPWSEITYKPSLFPTTWNKVANKPDLATANHTHPAYENVPSDWLTLLNKPTTFPTTWAEVNEKPALATADHTHTPATLDLSALNMLSADSLQAMIVLMPDCDAYYSSDVARCNGQAIPRDHLAGMYLVAANCPFGTGDGETTVNTPTLTPPVTGLAYYMITIGR